MTRKPRYDYIQQAKQALESQPEVQEELAVQTTDTSRLPRAERSEPPTIFAAADALRQPEAYVLPAQQRGKQATEGLIRRTDIAREQLNVRIRPELKRAAAGLAGLQGKTLGDVVEAALVAYIRAHGQG